jgi:2,3-bisphosphoglycerate-independent phosphoglycerate mutase
VVPKANRKVLVVVMDGVGKRSSNYGNAFQLAQTPQLDFLSKNGFYRELHAHGTYVGLPSNADMGNSEVGHNALGAGRVFDQGAKLVQQALDSGRLYEGQTWTEIIKRAQHSTLHFIGLLSDGNVHSHENHLYSLIRKAAQEGIRSIRLHILLDGRDVAEKSAETYIERLQKVISEVKARGVDIRTASGGGRMTTTMDRYEADWTMVERGWTVHARGKGSARFSSLSAALKFYREDTALSDQYIPPFVIDEGETYEGMKDKDCVVFFNFRGDRAIEISRVFEEKDFTVFDRGPLPDIFYAGMMEYDGDLHIPKRYLVSPPAIDDTLGEYLVHQGLRQFACSETQKYGHVTYFWNGNRSGMFDNRLEEYLEIPSDNIPFDLKPWMKAYEITNAVIDRMMKDSFDFARINYPNGDMVGHTGNLEASIAAVGTVDLCIGRLLQAAKASNTIVVITADHGNCDEMFDTSKDGPSNWLELPFHTRPKPKTSHTLNPVPFYLFDPKGLDRYSMRSFDASIAHLPNTVLALLGLKERSCYLPGLLEVL